MNVVMVCMLYLHNSLEPTHTCRWHRDTAQKLSNNSASVLIPSFVFNTALFQSELHRHLLPQCNPPAFMF